MAKKERLEGRDGEIWKYYCAGWTQEALAARYGIAQQRVSQVIRDVREKIGKQDRDEFIDRQVDQLQALQARCQELIEAEAPIAFSTSGKALQDPITGEYMRDEQAKMRAIAQQQSLIAQTAKLLGLDATKTLDVTVTAAEKGAAEALASEALSSLHGGEDFEP